MKIKKETLSTVLKDFELPETPTKKRYAEKKSKGKKAKKIIVNIVMVLTVLLLGFTVISVVFFNQKDMYLFGYKPYVISSESMAPVYKKNCVVLIKKNTYDTVEVGDLIAFKAHQIGDRPAFHRVVEITEQGFITKGDAVKERDNQVVTRDDFLGSETGHTNAFANLIPIVQTPLGFFMVIILPILLIAVIIIIVRMIIKA